LIARSYAVLFWFPTGLRRGFAAPGPSGPQSTALHPRDCGGIRPVGFLFLKKLLPCMRASRPGQPPLPLCLRHDRPRARQCGELAVPRPVQSILGSGGARFRTFDLERDRQITLVHSGETLSRTPYTTPGPDRQLCLDTTAQTPSGHGGRATGKAWSPQRRAVGGAARTRRC